MVEMIEKDKALLSLGLGLPILLQKIKYIIYLHFQVRNGHLDLIMQRDLL